MRRYIDRRAACRLIGRGLAGALLVPASACGTLLHPERRGQRGGYRLDPAIVILDAVGLLLFFIPGIIAFAVDFANGTIYLPPEEVLVVPAAEAYSAAQPIQADTLRTVQVGGKPTQAQIEAIVRRETSKTVRLDGPEVQVARLEQLDQFGIEAGRLALAP